jgi:hypothetical protein
MTSWAARRRDEDSEWRIERYLAEAVACPRCQAVARVDDGPDRLEQHCRNAITGRELQAPAHDARIKLAGQVAAEENQP